MDIYDVDTGLWSTATLSQARRFLAATTLGNKAIFAGGGSTGHQTEITSYDTIDIYDLETCQWTIGALSEARMQLAAATAGSKALFAGGKTWHTGESFKNVVDIYTPEPATVSLLGCRRLPAPAAQTQVGRGW